jgi:hypothetical protein
VRVERMDAVVMGSWSCLRDWDYRMRLGRPRKRRDSSCLPRLSRLLPDGSEVRESFASAVGADDRNYSSRSNRYIQPLCYRLLLFGTVLINQGYATVCPFAECRERLRRTPDPSVQASWTSRGAFPESQPSNMVYRG